MLPGDRVATQLWVCWQEVTEFPVAGSMTLTVAVNVPVARPGLSLPETSTVIAALVVPVSWVPLNWPLALRETSSSAGLGTKPDTGLAGVSTPPPGYQSPLLQSARHEIAIERSTLASGSALTTIGSPPRALPPYTASAARAGEQT